MKTETIRTYADLVKIDSPVERYRYLKLGNGVGQETFGFDRYLNQAFYKSKEWKHIRDLVISRDNGCDMGHPDCPINGRVIIHHMNPIDDVDIIYTTDRLMNPDYLICVSHQTHNAIHYGDESLLYSDPIERTPNDTCPWRK